MNSSVANNEDIQFIFTYFSVTLYFMNTYSKSHVLSNKISLAYILVNFSKLNKTIQYAQNLNNSIFNSDL